MKCCAKTKGIGIRDPDFLKAELESRTAEVTLVGGYRVVDKGPVTVDLLAGGRMNFFKTSLQLEGPNRSASGSVKQSWLDPLVAARVNVPLGGKWSFSTYGDLGGILSSRLSSKQSGVEMPVSSMRWSIGGVVPTSPAKP